MPPAPDFRSDQFSLGAVLYEMATGKRAFQRESAVETLSAIIRDEPDPPAASSSKPAGQLSSLLERCLAKSPEGRYAQTMELVHELRAVKRHPSPKALESSGISQPAPSPSVRRHIVGRDEARTALRESFESVARGRGLLLCVAGEPGIGKTTLVEAFLADLTSSGRPCTIARGRCSERLAGTEAYLPVLEALESLLHEDAVARVIKSAAPTWYFEIYPNAADETGVRRASSQERLKSELRNLLQELSRVRPVLLLFDDLHWADPSTVDLLAYLGSRLESLPILIVVTYRMDELKLGRHPFLPLKLDLQARGLCREMSLPFLGKQDIDRYLSLEFPEHRFPAELAELIHGRTEGSPLFMADLLRHLKDQGAIVEEGGVWRMAHSAPDMLQNLPESVRSMIQRKVDRLSEADRRLLAAASVQGPRRSKSDSRSWIG